jgi:hypothetical protein
MFNVLSLAAIGPVLVFVRGPFIRTGQYSTLYNPLKFLTLLWVHVVQS